MTRTILSAAVLALAGCAATPATTASADSREKPMTTAAAPAASIAGTRWVGKGGAGLDEKMLPRLEFVREGRLAGFTGCNMLSGTWRMEGDEVVLESLVTTKRGCLGPAGEVEKQVLAALAQGSRVKLAEGKIVVEKPGGGTYEFTRAAADR